MLSSPKKSKNTLCCDTSHQKRKDYFFISLIFLTIILYGGHLFNIYLEMLEGPFSELFDAFYQLLNRISWGIGIGILSVGILTKMPREYILSLLGKPSSKKSIFKATLAGIFLDLCSHGILMIGMNLYKKGASLGQVMAFLIASPWNSLSLTFILFTLIGFKWTLLFILLSAIIGIFSGFVFQILEKKNILPKNPNEISLPKGFNFWKQVKKDFKKNPWVLINFKSVLKNGFRESKIIIKWVLFGALLSSLVKVFIDESFFHHYFGPTLLGLGITLGLTTIIEICSEGAAPLGADLFQKGQAPGNGFVFLMGGVSTDYTEIIVLKETTKSWKIALFLPLITIPQILVIGFILNQLS